MSEFNAAEFIANANARERSARDGKAPAETEHAAPGKPAEKPAVETPAATEEPAHTSRSQRRLLRQLGEAEGRNKVYQELLAANAVTAPAAGTTAAPAKPAAADDDPEPKREAFSDDATFNRALGRWDARQESKKVVTETVQSKEQLDALRDTFRSMDAKAQEDRKLLPDWDDVAKAAAADEDAPEFVPDEHPNLMGMLATSDQKAFLLYHFAKNPEALRKMLNLTKTPAEQIRAFHRLEGKLEKEYGDKKPAAAAAAAGDKKSETAAERDARKAKPSESVAVKGGSAPATDISPTLADGKTLNPLWLEKANAREHRR